MLIKKRFITLIEIMVVIFLIGLIAGVLAYNFGGSLEKGKAFKTEVAIEKISTILNLKAAEDPSFLNNLDAWQDAVRASPLVKNPNDFLRDGWGGPYDVHLDGNIIKVRSENLERYKREHPGEIGR